MSFIDFHRGNRGESRLMRSLHEIENLEDGGVILLDRYEGHDYLMGDRKGASTTQDLGNLEVLICMIHEER